MSALVRVCDNRFNVTLKISKDSSFKTDISVGEHYINFLYSDTGSFIRRLEKAYFIARQNGDYKKIMFPLFSESIYFYFLTEMFFETEEYSEVEAGNIPLGVVTNKLRIFIDNTKEYMLNRLNFMIDANGMDKLTSSRRLLVFDLQNPKKYNPLKSDLISSEDFLNPVYGEDISNLATSILDADIDYSETYVIEDINSLMQLEIIKILQKSVVLKTCAHCNRLFIPEKRIDTEYCSRLLPNEDIKTCMHVGAMLKYKERTKDSPAHAEYTKAYKRKNSRMRNKKLTPEEFAKWAEIARKKRDKCTKGDISLEDFINWINQDKIYK